MANYVDEYQRKAHKFADYPVPTIVQSWNLQKGVDIPYVYPAQGLAEEAGEVAGKYAKAVRDCNGVIDQERKKEIVKELGDVCWFVAELATLLDVPLSDVMQGNLDKLESRQARGVIHGNGDNR